MRSFFAPTLALATGLFSSLLVGALPSLSSDGLISRAASCNTPSNRACWTTGFDINTDYEDKIPLTGKTKTVSLGLDQMTCFVSASK